MADARAMDDAMTPTGGAEAGAMLRAARERRGIEVATLASLLKVPPSRLEALEAGRYAELPDATFARALAQTVCRSLGIDAGPVLERLPRVQPTGLEKVSTGLNTPFRDRPGHAVQAEWAPWRKPALWAAAVLLLGAAAFFLLPPHGVVPWLEDPLPAAGGAPAAPGAAASTAATAAPAAAVALPVVPAAPVEAPPAPARSETASAPAVSAPTTAATRVSALRPSWIQATDAGGQVLLSRELATGETVELAAAPPLRLRIGNAAATQLVHRGQVVDLEPFTRDNVANVELH